MAPDARPNSALKFDVCISNASTVSIETGCSVIPRPSRLPATGSLYSAESTIVLTAPSGRLPLTVNGAWDASENPTPGVW